MTNFVSFFFAEIKIDILCGFTGNIYLVSLRCKKKKKLKKLSAAIFVGIKGFNTVVVLFKSEVINHYKT